MWSEAESRVLYPQRQCAGLCLGRGRAGQFGVTVGSPSGHHLRRSEENQTVPAAQVLLILLLPVQVIDS